MKKIGTIFLTVFFAALCFSFQPVSAQDKTKEDKERELRMQEEIDAQKKALEEHHKQMQLQQKTIENAMKKAKIELDSNRRFEKYFKNFDGDLVMPYISNEPFYLAEPREPFFGWKSLEDGEKTTWEFTKSIKENSFSNDYTFDVESTANTVVMAVNGDCKQGEIRIKIVMPNGKTYSDILIDEYGNLNWRKSFAISDEENKDKAGSWKFHIGATKATGYFRISLQTY